MCIQVSLDDPEAEALIPPRNLDSSGVGVNYVNVIVKKLKGTLDDGRAYSCKRRGLKLTLTVGESKGEGLMRRLKYGPDVKNIFAEALLEAAKGAGLKAGVAGASLTIE